MKNMITKAIFMKRPDLTKNLDPVEFTKYYYLKEELEGFCKSNHLNYVGSKTQLTKRIEEYLKTGIVPLTMKVKSSSQKSNEKPTLDTIISFTYTNNETNRAFFKSIIGEKFHFTTLFMKFFKNNIGKTYKDAINEWHAEQEERKKGEKTALSSQFEYNQFIRDYFQDPKNKGKSLKEAISEWNKIKILPGERKYRSS